MLPTLLCRFVPAGLFLLALAGRALAAASVTDPDSGNWSFYASAHDNYETARYDDLLSQVGHPLTVAQGTGGLPQVAWDSSAPHEGFQVSPQADKLTPQGKGAAVLSWKVPQAGNWKLSLSITNIGTDVFGGAGGFANVTRLPAGEPIDASRIFIFDLPSSRSSGNPVLTQEDVIKLAAGDAVNIRLGVRIDGYGNRFVVKFRAVPTEQAGREIKDAGYAAFIPNPPAGPRPKAAPLEEGMYWQGGDGGWSITAYPKENFELLKKYVPKLLFVRITSFPELVPVPSFFRDRGIPVIAQSWGGGYEPFLKANNGFEKTWDGMDLSLPNQIALGTGGATGDAHSLSMPSAAARRAFGNAVVSALRTGNSGSGFCDMVWPWVGGRGASGYNSESIAAFRRDLAGTDDGLPVSLPGVGAKTFRFADYANYYLGGLPAPHDFGLASWADYTPITAHQFQARTDQSGLPDFLLFDLLCHYEWLKFADFMGRTAEKEGGFFQAMPNPEDMANCNDYLFLNALTNVRVRCDEFFDSPGYLDGAYYHYPYLAAPHRLPRQTGVVMECGAGGNDLPYYANELAYVTAYELTAATRADMMEGDFWPAAREPLAQAARDPGLAMRYQELLAYALGFQHARADQAQPVAPQFVSVTSRRLFRPWGTNWDPWEWNLAIECSPDKCLAQAGFAFRGVGEEELAHLPPQPLLFYSPHTPTQKGWETFAGRLRAGEFQNAIVVTAGLQQVVTRGLAQKPFASLYPDFAVSVAPAELNRGRLYDGTQTALGDATLEVHGSLGLPAPGDATVIALNQTPLVTRRAVGKGTLYEVLFDPSLPANVQVGQAVFRQLLGQLGVVPSWTTPDDISARVYRADGMTVVGAMNQPRLDTQEYARTQATHSFLPYESPDNISVSLRVPPGASYDWLALPSGARGTTRSGVDGLLALEADKVTCQLFFVVPSAAASSARLDAVAKRLEVFRQAMTLNGLVSAAPSPSKR